MLKKLLFAIALTTYGAISAQTTLIDPAGDGGFETGATFGANGWTELNPPYVPAPPIGNWNRWVANTAAVGYTGARAAYINNNIIGAPAIPPYASYSASVPIQPKIHRIIAFPAGETDITLSFDWQGVADADDFLRVLLVPTGNAIPNGPYAATGVTPADVNLIGSYTGQASWANATITIPAAYAGNSSRLVFEWSSNATVGGTPAAIDNISLVSVFVASYCTPDSTNTTYWIEDFSTNVGGGASDISNLGSGFTATGYQDNTATDIVEQFPGGVIDFLTDFSGTVSTFGFNIWVDWNSDGDFADAGENMYASAAFVTGVDADFTVPIATTPGDYRMRIRADFLNTNPGPCGTIGNGEAEDYTLTVANVNCTDNPSGISVSAINFTTATINWTAPATAPGIGYEYFITTNTNTPIPSQIGTGTTNNVTTTANLTGLTDGTTYYVWVRSLCDGSFGGTGNWIGSVAFTTLVSPPTTTGVSICPGDPSQDLTAVSSACAAPVNLGTQLNGALDATDPAVFQPDLPILGGGSSATCAFKTVTANYHAIDFSVDVTGIYTFAMAAPVPDFDAMGYIVLNDGNFTPGSCATGTWLLGDDDSGAGFEPELVVNLTAGVNYTLITTKFGFGDTTHTGPYTWNISGPGSLLGPPAGSMDWYTTPTGVTPIFSGINFDPVGVAGSGLTDTNTTGIYSYWAACASSPGIRTQADFVIGKVWTGVTDTNWDTATNWSPTGIPTDTECVVIPNVANPPIIDSTTDALGFRLIVENGATLTQNSNSTLTITDAVTVNTGGIYTMLDGSSLIQDNNVANTVNGTFSMERTANMRRSDYVYWSSPVASFPVEDISPLTPNGYKYEWQSTVTGRPIGPPPDFVPNDYGDWLSSNTGTMDVGKGYAIKGPTGHTTAASPYTATFTGTPNNGTITQPIERGTYTGADYTYIPNGAASLTVTSDDDNWNFIGNPYPSALHLEDFLYHPANTNIDGACYIWTHGTAIGSNGQSFYDEFIYSYSGLDYLTVNATGNSIPDPYKGFVAAGQGFFVLMNDTGTQNETVEFQNYMRRFDYRNDQFFRSAGASDENLDNKHRIWLDYIDSSGNTNTMLVGYVNGATNGKDRMFDAKTTKGEGLNLYSMIDEDNYIIQGRQTPFVDTDTVPLGINITESGIQTIAINTLEGLFIDTDQDIYIEDLVTGITHNITNAPYTFTSDAGVINDRLVLRYTANALSIEDFDILNGIKVFEENDVLIVKSEHETIKSIEVYDLLGRNLFTDTTINQTRFTVSAITPSNTTLFLKIKLVNGQQKIAKIIF